jgi:hypothetical protein
MEIVGSPGDSSTKGWSECSGRVTVTGCCNHWVRSVPSFVVHVGPHKTGSTYLQRRLLDTYLELQRQGIEVPKNFQANEVNPSHTGLEKRLTPERFPELEHQFTAWRRGDYRCVVISAEGISGLHIEQLQLLRKLLGDSAFQIVYYVRAWPELMMSAWNEIVVHGGRMALPEFLARNLHSPYASQYMNLQNGLSRFETVFGMTSIKLVSYNAVLEAGLDLYAHFVQEFLGAAGLSLSPKEIANPSFLPAEAELVRALNCLHQDAGGAVNAQMAQSYRFRPKEVDAGPILDVLNSHLIEFEIDSGAKPHINVMLNNYNRYKGLLVPPAPAGGFYAPKKTTIRYISSDYALRSGILPEIAALRQKLLGQDVKGAAKTGLLGRFLGRS